LAVYQCQQVPVFGSSVWLLATPNAVLYSIQDNRSAEAAERMLAPARLCTLAVRCVSGARS